MSDVLTDIVSFIDRLSGFTTTELRLAVTAIILLVVLASAVGARYLRRRIRERVPNHVADVAIAGSILTVLVGTAVALLVLWGEATSVANAIQRIDDAAGQGVKVLLALVVVAGAYVLTGFVKRAIDRLDEENDTISRHQGEIVYRVSQLTVYVTAIAAVLGMWQVDLSGLLVGAGFLGIIVGMAARQTLGSVLAGFVLMFSRPFEIGDWIEVDDREGIVTDISIVNTRVQTFDGEYVMVPNDIINGRKIVNKSRKGRLRVAVEVGVDYDADLDRAVELAEEAMRDRDEVLSVPAPQVVLKEFGDSAVVLGLRFWIDKPSARRQWRARTAVIGAVKRAFDREGIKIPFPQRELTGREETDGLRVAGERSAPEPTPDGGDGGVDRT